MSWKRWTAYSGMSVSRRDLQPGIGIMEFPKKVWPYLEYHGIVEEYYASHSCVYTESGLVVRKEKEPEMGEGYVHGIQIHVKT